MSPSPDTADPPDSEPSDLNPYQAPCEALDSIEPEDSQRHQVRRMWICQVMCVMAWFWTIPVAVILMLLVGVILSGSYSGASALVFQLLAVTGLTIAGGLSIRSAFCFGDSDLVKGNQLIGVSVLIVLCLFCISF